MAKPVRLATVKPVVGPMSLGTGRHFRIAARALENGEVLAYCTTLPGALAQEPDLRAAIESLHEVLEEMIRTYIEDEGTVPHRPVPMERGDRLVATFAMSV
jgi:predicted RNase H-like HicB family nuclease